MDLPHQLRDESSVMVIHLVKRGGETSFDPVGACPVEEGDQVTVQATLNAWEGLRDKLRAA